MKKEEISRLIDELNAMGDHFLEVSSSGLDKPLPDIEILNEIISSIKKVLFPGFWGYTEVNPGSMEYYVGVNLDIIQRQLSEQIKRGFCFNCKGIDKNCSDCEENSKRICSAFMNKLPDLKKAIINDVIAAFKGDPAAKNYEEVLFCYPGIIAMTYHRIAHELFKLDVPLIPRMINELAHSLTGIDIHPGARIGNSFFIDHGTGVVIGETCIIGDNVRLYQGVTLGAKSFPLDEEGKPIKGLPRHPEIGNDVVVYANATILGRIKIEDGTVVKGNAWIVYEK